MSMSKLRYILLPVLLLSAAPVLAAGQFFPKDHPLDIHKAEQQGLHRLSAAELKAFIPGTMEAIGHRGGRGKIRIYRPDGSFEAHAFKKRKGTWRIDEKNNTWCRTVVIKMQNQEKCFAVFRAPDGRHYFDYDTGDGFYAGAWRPQQK
jgi:hypothetical protein